MNDELLERSTARIRKNFAPVIERVERRGESLSEAVKKTGVVDAAAPARGGKPAPIQGSLVSMEHEFIFGTVKTVADKIIEQCRQTKAGNIMAHHSPALTREECARLYGEFWPQVVKILSTAEVMAEAT